MRWLDGPPALRYSCYVAVSFFASDVVTDLLCGTHSGAGLRGTELAKDLRVVTTVPLSERAGRMHSSREALSSMCWWRLMQWANLLHAGQVACWLLLLLLVSFCWAIVTLSPDAQQRSSGPPGTAVDARPAKQFLILLCCTGSWLRVSQHP